jgi:hypothetical protein
MKLTYGNWQRLGGAIHMKLEEAREYTIQSNGDLHVSAAYHKTSLTHWPVIFLFIGIQDHNVHSVYQKTKDRVYGQQ